MLLVAVVAAVGCAAAIGHYRSSDIAALEPAQPARATREALQSTLMIEYRGPDGPQSLELSLSELERLDVRRLSTSTPFTRGVLSLSGPRGDAIAGFVAADFETVRLTNLNGRTVEIEAEVFLNRAVLATRLSGDPIPIRDNGPFWLVFDFDASDQSDGEFLRARSLAHVRSLAFR